MADEAWKELASSTFDVVKDSLKGFLESQEVETFAKEKTELFAREYWKSINAPEADRPEHEANLKHLTAQVRGEARRLQIAISEEAKDTLGRILETVGGILIKAAPALLALL